MYGNGLTFLDNLGTITFSILLFGFVIGFFAGIFTERSCIAKYDITVHVEDKE